MLEESNRLVCAECGAISDEQARGWQPIPVSDDEELPLRDDNVAARRKADALYFAEQYRHARELYATIFKTLLASTDKCQKSSPAPNGSPGGTNSYGPIG